MTEKIKRFWLGVGAFAALIAVLAAFQHLRASKPEIDLSIRLESQRGGYVRLSEALSNKNGQKNKGILIHFWASWCPPCLAEIHEFLKFAQNNPEKGLQFVIVSSDKNWSDLEKIVPKEKLPEGVLSLLDVESKAAESFGTFQFPETYLLTSDGKVIEKWVGPQKWEGIRLNNYGDLLGK